MGVNVTLVIPSIRQMDVNLFAYQIVNRWGGLTSWTASGCWSNADGMLAVERVTVLACSVRAMIDEDVYQWWHDLADRVRVQFDQDCVFLSFTPEDAELVGKQWTTKIGGNDEDLQGNGN